MKKYLSVLLALVLVLGMAVPAFAAEDTSEEEPFSQELRVHKIVYPEGTELGALTGAYEGKDKTDFTWKPEDVNFVENVWFDVYKEVDGEYKLISSDTTAYHGEEPDPYATFTITEKGKYKIVENHEKSTYIDENGEVITAGMAVEIELDLPLMDESGIAPIVNLFPKNTQSKPDLDKEIEEDPSVGESGLQVGDKVPYKVESNIPIYSKLKVVKFTDTMSDGLVFQDDDTVSVQLIGNETVTLTRGTAPEYTDAEYKVTTNGQTTTIELTPAGIEKLYNMTNGDNASEVKIVVRYQALLTEEAAVDSALTNEVKLTYGNNPDVTNEESSENVPEIKTYGKKFKKTDENGETLPGAKFLIRNDNEEIVAISEGKLTKVDNPNKGKYLSRDAYLEGKIEWVDRETAKESPFSGGEFEVKGLQAGTAYYLEEIEAPSGYHITKESKNKQFEIGSGTYEEVLVIKNQKIDLPVTGGIGSAIFVVVGLAMVATAVHLLKKREVLAK